jgi:DNA-binding SARP family transcriptional activator/predicted ATPase
LQGNEMVNVMNQLTIRLLGAPEILCAGGPLDLQHQKARALLCYLGATGRAHTRDHLATLFWGESDAASARHSLRSGLYNIRHTLLICDATEALFIDARLVGLQTTAMNCDVLRFRELVATGAVEDIRHAVALYRGPFLQGFTLADAPEFDRWQRSTADELRNACRDALERLVNWAEDRQAPSEMVRRLQHLVQLDPLDETTQRRLISFYLQEGSLAKAWRQFETLEKELREVLGVSPEPETAGLIQDALRRQGFGTKPLPRAEAVERLPLAGRDLALGHLRDLANEVAHGHGAAVLIQGDDGIGKTRLITELTDELAQLAPWRILRGECSPFDDLLAFGPFFEAFQFEATQRAIPGDLTELFVDSSKQPSDLPSGLFLRVLKTIRFLARGGPLVLALEDLQWASGATLRLFGFLATRLHEMPVLLIGSAHRAEAIPALLRLLVLGRRRGEVQLVTLDPLTSEDICDILRASHITSPSLQSLAAWLHERSGGNPYILGELLAQLRGEGILALKAGEWHVDSGRWLRWRATSVLPETTHDLVTGRLTGLSGAARRLLDVLAVAGEPLAYDLLRALPEGPGEHTPDIIEELREQQLIKETVDDAFDVPHHLLREALLYHLGRYRQRAIHRQLASMIEICPALQRQISTRQVARHAVAGGDVDLARQYGMQAVKSLERDTAGVAGVEFLRGLHDLLAPSAPPEEHFFLARALGQACRETGKLDEARRWFEQALERAQQAGDTVAQADACFEQAELALVANDYQAAVSAAQAGLATRGAAQPPSRAFGGRGHWLIGAALAMDGADLVQAERHLKKALAVYRRDSDPAGQCLALFELGNVAAQHGHLERALASYVAAAREAETASDHYFLALAHNNYAYHSLLLGRADAARQAVAEGRRIAERAAIPAALLHLCSTEGEIALYSGDWEAANDAFQAGLALAEEFGSLERQAGYRASLGLIAQGTGDADRATTLHQESLALLDGHGYWHLQTRVRLWLTESLLACERRVEARITLNAALTMARTHRRELLRQQGERLYARLLAAEGNWTAANDLFAQLIEQARRKFSLEAVRAQAAWGESALQHGSLRERAAGRERLLEARDHLVACGALAETAAIDRALKAQPAGATGSFS